MLGIGAVGESDCEAIDPGLVAQPVNAVTSLGFVLAGLAVLLLLTPSQRRGVGGLYALLLALVGIGSVLFHGPQTPGAKFLHDAPIVALGILIAVVVVIRWRGDQPIFPGATRNRLIALGVIAAFAGVSYLTGRTDSPACDPDSVVQPHGGWHLLSALVFVLVAALLFRAPRRGEPVA